MLSSHVKNSSYLKTEKINQDTGLFDIFLEKIIIN